MSIWRRLNRLRWFWRWPLKLVIFLVGTFLVLYPKFWLFPTCVERLADMNALLDPDHPEIAVLHDQLCDEISGEMPPPEALKAVQDAVCKRIPYSWDWDTWGVAEYLPTVAEVFDKGREDCDGRAVVAASVLRRMGYEASLVSDLLHVWVHTPQGETMSPTGGEKTLVGTAQGTKTKLSLRVLSNMARGLSYSVSVFPLTRELIILALIGVVAMQPRSSGWRRLCGCLVLWIALDTLRDAGQAAALDGEFRHVAMVWLGVGLLIAGWLILAVRAGGRQRRSVAMRPE
jgi:hypothetical protein